MRAVILAALAVALAVPASASETQFDLVCNGTKEWSGARSIEAGANPTQFRMRFDLEGKQYCYDGCGRLYDIDVVGAKALWLGKASEEADGGHVESVDRTTGEYFFFKSWAADSLQLQVKGSCKRAPFSGFPVVTTKF